MQQVDKWIEEIVKGKTFADVGGLWGTIKEKVTVAALAGASATAMVDITPLGNELWRRFENRCAGEQVSDYKCIQASIDDSDIVSKVGIYEVVHCSGVLYHCPNPLYTVSQLSKICSKSLILATTVIPEAFANSHGRVVMEQGGALFVPALSELQRTVISEYWDEVGVQAGGINMPLADGWSVEDYMPWWWLFTPEFVAALLKVIGFNIVTTALEWNDRNALYLAEKT